MSPLEELVQLVEEVSGLVVPPHDQPSLKRLALDQARREGHRDLGAYVRALRHDLDGSPWQGLLSRLTVKESYLFRAPQQLEALAGDLLPRLVAGRPPGRPVTVWSAGCARGEEPTSLAMVLAESVHLAGRTWHILATDVDESALAEARRGVFGRRALARLPAHLLGRYMAPRGGGEYALARELQARIHYRHLNLVGGHPLLLPEAPFDLVFLRNVLIYFRPEQQRRVVAAVVAALARDGFLFLGPAESLWHLETGLVPVDLGDCFCYRLPGGEAAPRATGVNQVEHTVPTDWPDRQRGEEVTVGPPPSAPAGQTGPPQVDPTNLEGILDAVSEGRLERARRVVAAAVTRLPDNPRLRALEGLVAELGGDVEEATRCYRAALYLTPRLYQVRFMLGRCLDRAGWKEQARSVYREALGRAERGTVADEIPGSGRLGIPSTRQVIAACRRALEDGAEDPSSGD